MKGWIRWWGLIAFAAVVGSLLLFWLLFADGLVRRAVENAGTALVGAEVNVGSADVSFFPLGITLLDIEVTDPQAPANNSIQIGRSAFSLDGLLLFRRKVNINELSVEAVRFNVPRKRPGRVSIPPPKKAAGADASFALPSLALPSIETVMASADVASLPVIEQARAELAASRSAWQQRVAVLPDKSALDAYRERVKALRAASRKGLKGLAESAPELRSLQRDLERDLAAVREAKQSFGADYGKSKETVNRALQAPQEDVRKILERSGLSGAGLQNLSRPLFGKVLSSRIDTALLWYRRLKPLMAREQLSVAQGTAAAAKPLRAKGVDVRFPERPPRPDLLVALVKASFQPPAGSFDGTVRNLTPDQDILGAPLIFSFSGTGLPSADRVAIDGKFDHVRPSRPEDTVHFLSAGYRAGPLPLSAGSDLPITLQQGVIDLDIRGWTDGTNVSGRVQAVVRNVRFETGGGGAIVSALRSSLARISRFTVTADITGTFDDHGLKVTSDLDSALKDAVAGVIGEKAAVFEKDVRAAVQARTGDAIKGLQGDLNGLAGIGDGIADKEGQLVALLKETTQGAGAKIKLPF